MNVTFRHTYNLYVPKYFYTRKAKTVASHFPNMIANSKFHLIYNLELPIWLQLLITLISSSFYIWVRVVIGGRTTSEGEQQIETLPLLVVCPPPLRHKPDDFEHQIPLISNLIYELSKFRFRTRCFPCTWFLLQSREKRDPLAVTLPRSPNPCGHLAVGVPLRRNIVGDDRQLPFLSLGGGGGGGGMRGVCVSFDLQLISDLKRNQSATTSFLIQKPAVCKLESPIPFL